MPENFQTVSLRLSEKSLEGSRGLGVALLKVAKLCSWVLLANCRSPERGCSGIFRQSQKTHSRNFPCIWFSEVG